MLLRHIPCCYFSTRVVLVDDHKIFSKMLALQLNRNVKIFNDALRAQDFLLNYQPQVTENIWLRADHLNEMADGNYHQPAIIDVSAIKALYSQPQRHQDISVVLMDYHLPEMNGLELLRRLPKHLFKTILLTNEKDHAMAIEAFNQGLIDYFLCKDEENLYQKLSGLIEKLQLQYFCEMSQNAHELLKEKHPLFGNAEIGTHFSRLLKRYDIQEFYLTNLQGQYLAIDKMGKKHHFCLYTQPQLNEYAQYAAEDNGDPKVIQALLQGEMAPFFGEDLPFWQVKANLWDKYLYPVTPFTTHSSQFLSVVA